MFGNLAMPVKPKLRPRPIPKEVDVPGTKPFNFGHIARDACTDYNIKMMQYEQRKKECEERRVSGLSKMVHQDKVDMKFMIHADKRAFKREMTTIFNNKLKEYDQEVESKREKLLDLLWHEDRQYLREVVEQAQKAEAEKFITMKQKTIELKAKREEERQELARQKKLQRIVDGCDLFRPLITKQRLIQSKQAQLQQMKDNEIKKETERELDQFWHQMMLKEVEAKEERDRQDKMLDNCHKKQALEVWAIQQKEKEIREQMALKEKHEDFIRVEKIREDILQEKIRGLDEKRIKRDKLLKEMQEEIEHKKQIIKRREEEERAVVRAYDHLVQNEIDKEKQKAKMSAADARREMQQFMDYIKRLEQEKKDEEKMLDSLIEESRKNIEKEQNEAFCKLERARQALKKATLQGLEEQIKYKKEEAEQQLKCKEAENKMIRFHYDQHKRILTEHERQKAEDSKHYYVDLKKQAEYTRMLREKEKEELERQLKIGLKEEEEFKAQIDKIINGTIKVSLEHPFKVVMNDVPCPCRPCPNK